MVFSINHWNVQHQNSDMDRVSGRLCFSEKFEWMINYLWQPYSVWPTDHKLGLFELPSRFISRRSNIWFTKTLLWSSIYRWRYLLCSMAHGTRNLFQCVTWHKSHRITPSSTRILSAVISLIMSYLVIWFMFYFSWNRKYIQNQHISIINLDIPYAIFYGRSKIVYVHLIYQKFYS